MHIYTESKQSNFEFSEFSANNVSKSAKVRCTNLETYLRFV